MLAATDVLVLRPGDLTQLPPRWDPALAPGEFAIAVIDGDGGEWAHADSAIATAELQNAPVLTIAVLRGSLPPPGLTAALDACDLLLHDAPDEQLIARLRAAGPPVLVAAQVLRAGRHGSVALESLAYSTLLFSQPFRAWRDRAERRPPADAAEPRVTLDNTDRVWRLTLTRPRRHNAFDAQMREELCDALDVIATEPPAPVVLLGEGPSFCSGGDLDEFGTAASPLDAHLIRCGRSVARRLRRLSDRLVAGLHGRCIGAGLELAAFAHTLVAAEGTTFQLPELAMGLHLGAGGSLSIPARIGRQRTLELLLAGEPLDAPTARDWGLVDLLVPGEELVQRCIEVAQELGG